MSKFDKQAAAERTEAVKTSLDQKLAELAEALSRGESQQFRAYLEAMSRFHSYSLGNTVLIFAQMPEATRVASYKTWQGLKRQVKKGQKGIAILAPMTIKDKEKPEETKVIGFKTVFVFDVSQTEGEELPEWKRVEVQGDADAVLDFLKGLCPYEVKEDNSVLDPDQKGLAVLHQGRRVIFLRPEEPAQSRAATLLHEWAHHELHIGHPDYATMTKGQKELEAEAVAYVMGAKLGLDIQSSADYIINWKGTPESLRQSLNAISRGVKAIGGVLKLEDRGEG